MNLDDLAHELCNFEGVVRKKPIADIARMFEDVQSEYSGTIVDMGDDAAVIDIGSDEVILFAADGIWGKIVDASPWWTGYTSIVVNVNDISAMGGRPLAMVNVMSSSDEDVSNEMLEGMREGIRKFGVPMVGGHMHPDTPYNSLAVAIIGIARKDSLIRSDTASAGDAIILAYDLDGKVGENSPYSWDTTSFKDAETVKARYLVMKDIGEAGLVTAGKDISNPGTIGTLGMLCETSGVGAKVDLSKIPSPESMPLVQWLKIYPATGYVVTVKPDKVGDCIKAFEDVGITATEVGVITSSLQLEIEYEGKKACVFDFEKDIITGIKSH
ncbi:methanogenesis marker 2 protein [Methanohalophilus sp.]|uniref:methanogenesis marker 2 protein n=1 Tax=Methanohalophilus sp. TaxID=1966352 RepID=UPI00261DE10E|nr:methanogenesis marker 2 protein [Methanohalophilus sp.]MDK2892311.1 uncharacterized protein [Methanohalophilus sp.]